jgi:anti-sigma28 factor (negative regulator of flagellin synthesis)
MAARLRGTLDDGIDFSRVRALRDAIACGLYLDDAEAIAGRMLAAIATARGH